MRVTKEFAEAVQTGKMLRVRIMLKNSLLVDPTTEQFQEMEAYAVKNMGNIYDNHNGSPLEYDVTEWNEDYLNQQMVAVVTNFSHERIDLLKQMVKYLFKEKVHAIRNARMPQNDSLTRKQIGTGVTAAGVIFTAAGICLSHTALTVGGAVVVVAGLVVIANDKGKNNGKTK